jgi:hypothetical protein
LALDLSLLFPLGERGWLGIAKINGNEAIDNIAIPKKHNVKPKAISEKLSSKTEIMTMLTVPPTVRNMPRTPVMAATFSGIKSRQALFDEGATLPIPNPENIMIVTTIAMSLTETPKKVNPLNPNPSIAKLNAIAKVPKIIGRRYPHLSKEKLVAAATTVITKDLGVMIKPLSNILIPYTETT